MSVLLVLLYFIFQPWYFLECGPFTVCGPFSKPVALFGQKAPKVNDAKQQVLFTDTYPVDFGLRGRQRQARFSEIRIRPWLEQGDSYYCSPVNIRRNTFSHYLKQE